MKKEKLIIPDKNSEPEFITWDNNRVRIGKRIAELRAEKGISQEKLSELSGVGSSHIARIELGRYSVGVDTLQKIANVFGKRIDFVDEERKIYLEKNDSNPIMKHMSGIRGVFIKEYKPTGKPLTTMIRVSEGFEFYAPSDEFKKI